MEPDNEKIIDQLKLSTSAIERMSSVIGNLSDNITAYSRSVDRLINMQADALKDSRRNAETLKTKAASNKQKPALSGAASLVKNISSASPVVGGLGIGLGSLGLGIGGFFMGLAGAEAVMNNFGTGDNLKKLIVNFGDAIESLDTRSLLTLGALLTGSALFMQNKSFGSQFKIATGMTAIGAGIGGFFAGLSAADAAMSWMSVDGSALNAMLRNLGDGLSAFSSRDLGALGALLGTSLFAANAGFGGMKAATGMTMIGAGIGGFFAGLTAVTDLAAFLGADGSGIKTMMTNIADGLSAFSSRDLGALGAMLAVGGLFGPAGSGSAALGMTAIGLGIGGFFTALSSVGDIAAYFGADGSGIKTMMINIADGLSAFNGVDASKVIGATTAMALLSPALIAFFGAQGISSVLDAISTFVTWVSGGDDPITTVVNQLKKFEEVNFDKLSNSAGISVGSMLQDIATGLSAFSSANFDAAVLGVLTDVVNWFGGDEDPFAAIVKVGERATQIEAAANAIERIALAMTKFAEVPSAVEFDFEKMANQLVSTVPLLDAVLHGGEIDDWGINTVINKGLLSEDFRLNDGIDAINKMKQALTAMYNIDTNVDMSAAAPAPSAAPITPRAAAEVETAATERAQREISATLINSAPSTITYGGSSQTVNNNTTVVNAAPHQSLNQFMPT